MMYNSPEHKNVFFFVVAGYKLLSTIYESWTQSRFRIHPLQPL
jgi:hypothetical protein